MVTCRWQVTISVARPITLSNGHKIHLDRYRCNLVKFFNIINLPLSGHQLFAK